MAPGGAASAPPGASAAAPRPGTPPAPPPFAEVVRDATRQDGFVPVWRKDDRVWLELAPEQFGRPFMLAANVSQSVGERGLYASQMGPSWMAEFRRHGNQVQLAALQTAFRADGDPALQRTVRESFSDSLLAATSVASAPHPERKSVLVDASFLLADIIAYGTALERAYRVQFGLDRANSRFESVHVTPGLTTLGARMHYAIPRIPVPPPAPPGGGGPPPPSTPSTTPDPRSVLVGIVYTLRALPAQAMAGRRADPRVGHFVETYTDLSTDTRPDPRVHLVKRWRLEKKDPQAALSEPVQPIVFWLDRNIPARYRPAVEAGVLEWNRAFERIGFRDALVVRQQPDDAASETVGGEGASIRWFFGRDAGFARGPSHHDPRSGEILDAMIAMSDVFGRGARRVISEQVLYSRPEARPLAAFDGLWPQGAGAACEMGDGLLLELEFARELLAARGELDPAGPEADALAEEVVKSIVMHEVGHVLGLRHNFRASTAIDARAMRDVGYVRANGLGGSVMDYLPYNLPLRGEPGSVPTKTVLGPYDLWAIEYAYRPLAGGDEATALDAIASRGRGDPRLVYADDADAGLGGEGFDPRVNRFDLGDDPLAWVERQFMLTRELWERLQERGALPGDDANRLRRGIGVGFQRLGSAPAIAAKYVGGMYVERTLPDAAGDPVYRPVPPTEQRRALALVMRELFDSRSFAFRPELLAQAGPDFVDFGRSPPVSVPQAVLGLQTQALDRLLAGATLQRLLDQPAFLPPEQRSVALGVDELLRALQSSIWSELRRGGEIDPLRRNLQREHLRRLHAALTRGGASMPADVASLVRWNAVRLERELRVAAGRPGLRLETRAHLEDSLSLLRGALDATTLRQ